MVIGRVSYQMSGGMREIKLSKSETNAQFECILILRQTRPKEYPLD